MMMQTHEIRVHLEGRKAYISIGENRGIAIERSYRRRLHNADVTRNGEHFQWECTRPDIVEDILYLNCPKQKNEGDGMYGGSRLKGYVRYTNLEPDKFYAIPAEHGDKISTKFTRSFVEDWLQRGAPELRKIYSNSVKEPMTNAFDEPIPYFIGGSICSSSYGDDRGAVMVDEMPLQDVERLEKMCSNLLKDSPEKFSFYTRDWLTETFLPSMRTYIAAKKASAEEIQTAFDQYSQDVKAVNQALESHADDFIWSDDGEYGFDCGFLYMGFKDEKRRSMSRFLRYAQKDVPQIKFPYYVQSLTVKRREFQKAKEIAAKIGYDICISGSELD